MSNQTDIELAQAIIDANVHLREWIRRVDGDWYLGRYNREIRVVEGIKAPTIEGEPFRWETLGGTPIAHPTAYSRKGFSHMRYVGSTERIEVGVQWLASHRPRTFGPCAGRKVA